MRLCNGTIDRFVAHSNGRKVSNFFLSLNFLDIKNGMKHTTAANISKNTMKMKIFNYGNINLEVRLLQERLLLPGKRSIMKMGQLLCLIDLFQHRNIKLNLIVSVRPRFLLRKITSHVISM